METEKQQSMLQTYRQFMQIGLSGGDPGLLYKIVDEHISGFGSAIDEKVHGFDGLKKLLDTQTKQSKGLDIKWRMEPVSQFITPDENTAVFADDVFLRIDSGEEIMEMYLRFSAVLNYTDGQWKVIHWHGSKPEAVESEKDTWGLEKWKQKAGELEKLVAEKTSDLVEKNRELEIEAALERVRSRTMAMQKSDELPEAANLLFQQVQSLGMPAWSAGYCIWNDDKTAVTLWMSSEGVLQPPFIAPTTEDELFMQMRKGFEDGKALHICEMGGKDLEQHYQYMRTLPVVGRILDSIMDAGHPLPTFQIMHQAYFSKGFLLFITYEPVPEAHEIFKRFASVFDQTYTRFLDLQKAEAQAREAEIQLALERVRARTMAMHKSDELAEVAVLLFQQVKALGITTYSSGFTIWNTGENVLFSWMCNADGSINPPFIMPATEYHWHRLQYQSWKNKEDHIVHDFTGEEMEHHYRYLRSFPLLDKAFRKSEQAGIETPVRQVHNVFNFSYGNLLFITLEPAEEYVDIFSRFAKVFEQCYTRFLDLQKAEAQAREAQIETALERIRARALAMHNSNELTEVAKVLREQMSSLGQPELETSAVHLYDEDPDYILSWRAFRLSSYLEGKITYGFFKIPKGSCEIANEFIQKFKSSEVDYTIEVSGSKQAEWYKILFKLAPEVHEAMKKSGTVEETRYYHFSKFSGGALLMVSSKEPSQDAIELQKRSAQVFDLAYRRFKDLQKAEAQARAAQIEVAVERVRAKALAMHRSDEIHEVVRTLRHELFGLNLEGITGATICLKQSDGQVRFWDITDVETTGRYGWDILFDINEIDPRHWVKRIWDSKDKIVAVEQVAEDLKRTLKWLGQYDQKMADDITELLRNNYITHGWHRAVKLSDGILITDFANEAPAEIDPILLKMGAAFDLAYKRFLDLQKAEEQAREAQIEAALERLRSRSMAMHDSSDLSAVVFAMFTELVKLDAQLDRCLILIVNPQTLGITWYLTGKEGLLSNNGFLIPDNEHPSHKAYLDGWRTKRKKWQYFLAGEEKRQWDDYGFHQTELAQLPDFIKADMAAVEAIHLTISSDDFGCLIASSLSPLSDAHAGIVERFTVVFNQTYTRFLDLKKAEAQTREAEIQLALERVRARSLAMHHTNELQDVVNEVAQQLLQMGIEIDGGVFITINDEVTHDFPFWAAAGATDYVQKVTIPFFNRPTFTALRDAILQRQPFYTDFFPLEEKNAFLNHLFRHHPWNQNSEERKAELLARDGGYTRSVVVNQHTSIGITNHHGKRFSDADNEILKRFGAVLEQSYTRFLDLQKAEAQARESQIQLSLERVRARSMAMQHSDELSAVLSVLFEQYDTLGINPMYAHLSLINIEENTFSFRMTGTAGQRIMVEQIIDVNERPEWKEALETWKNSEPGVVSCIHYPVEVLPQVWELFGKIFKALPPESMIYPEQFPDGLFTTQGHCRFGYIGFEHTRSATEEEKDIVKRIAHDFALVYQRFLDLQKAEAQAREAQIEAALERVRSSSMAMHKSEELHKVINIVAEQIAGLGISNDGTNFTKVNDDNSLEQWIATPTSPYPLQVHIPYMNHPVVNGYVEVWRKEIDFAVTELSFEEKNEFFKYFFENTLAKYSPEDRKQYVLQSKGVAASLLRTQSLILTIYNYACVPFSHDENEIFKRFAKVFEQAYTRFLDLQKAEAQAREAQIEASLEKVRSRSLAMHRSSEIQEVVAVVFTQLQQLGFNFEVIGIGTRIENTNDVFLWIGNDQNTYANRVMLPLMDFGPSLDAITAMDSQVPFFSKVYSFEEKNRFWNFAFENSGFRNLPETRKQYILDSQSFSMSVAPVRNIVFLLIDYSGKVATEQEAVLVKRFAQVFEQCYVRFMDLQKAEAQAREAQIEAALERVRSRSISMRKSEEIADIAAKIFSEMRQLDLHLNRVLIWTFNDTEKYTTWWSSNPEVESTADSYRIDYNDTPVFLNYLQAWQKRTPIHLYTLCGEAKKNWENHLFEHTELSKLPMAVKNGMRGELTLYTVSIISDYGIMMSGSLEPLSDQSIDIIQRFGRVFQQSYTRYLDVQKAEEQARESQIQLALERVRARSMAMQHSDELAEVSYLLNKQVVELGIPTRGCAFNIYNEHDSTEWFSNLEGTLPAYKTPRENIFLKYYEAGRRGETLLVEAFGKERITQHYEYLFSLGYFGNPEHKEEVLAKVMPESQIDHVAFFKYGYLLFITLEPAPEAHDIFKRFAKEFEQTYTRFLDLKKAEAQAREATKQASLERVRGEITSMRSAQDLEIITPLLWRELTNLGIPFIRCGVFIMHAQRQTVDVHLSSPDGKPLAVMHLAFDSNELTTHAWEAWKKGELYRHHWDKQDFINYGKEMVAQGQVKDLPSYQGNAEAPDSLYLHFIPFAQGLLYVGSPQILEEEQIGLVQMLAKAFAMAYARYEDFVKLEQAKAEVETTLGELKATQAQLVQQEKLASLGQLTAGIAHEIKNPLNFVNNFSEVSLELIEESLDELVRGPEARDEALLSENLEHIRSNMKKVLDHGSRANSIVTSMLMHSRGGSGTAELTPFNEFVKEYGNLAYHGMRASKNPMDVKMRFDLDDNVQDILLVAEDFSRVILNICNNAFDAMRSTSGAKLTIRTQLKNGTVQLQFEDNGPGIPDAIRDKIFQPFFTTKKGTEGTGLGLSISHDIVKAHGGELRVETKVGEGTRFLITLPIQK